MSADKTPLHLTLVPSRLHMAVVILLALLAMVSLALSNLSAFFSTALIFAVMALCFFTVKAIYNKTPKQLLLNDKNPSVVFAKKHLEIKTLICLFQSSYLTMIKTNVGVIAVFADSLVDAKLCQLNHWLRIYQPS